MSNRTEAPIPLEMFVGEAKAFEITCSEAVDSAALRFVAHDTMRPPVGEFEVENDSIDKDGFVATVNVAAEQTTDANDHLAWVIWQTETNKVLAHGTLVVRPAVKDIA